MTIFIVSVSGATQYAIEVFYDLKNAQKVWQRIAIESFGVMK